jgi:PST family polysaccharide transporter
MGNMQQRSDSFWLALLPAFLRSRFTNRHHLQRTFNSGAWLLFDRAVRIAVGIIISAAVARYLGPSQFGALTYVIVFLSFFLPFADVGLENVLLRDFAVAPQRSPQVLASAVLMRLLMSSLCIVLALVLLAALYGADSQTFVLGLLAGGFLLGQAADVVDLWFRSQTEGGYPVRAKLANYVFFSIIKVVLIWNHASIFAFAAIFTIETLTVGVSLIYLFKKHAPFKLEWTIDWALMQEMVATSWPFITSAFILLLSSRIDVVYIQRFIGAQSVAFYTAAQTLSGLGILVPSILFSVLTPTLSRLREEDELRFLKVLQATYQVAVLWGLVSGAFLFFFSNVLVSLIYGVSYAQAGPVLHWLAWGNVFAALGLVQGQWLFTRQGNRIVLIQAVCACFCITLLNLILIPQIGLLGSALAYILVQFIAYILINAFLQKQIFKMQLQAFCVWQLLSFIQPAKPKRASN